MKLRVIGADLVRRLLTWDECISSTRAAMILTARGQAVQPIRSVMQIPGQINLLGLMPGYTDKPRWLGIKATAVFPENFVRGLSSHQGMICMFDAQSGTPVALVEGGTVTAMRTAAASAVATDALAPLDASSLGIFGYGEQAKAHLQTIPLVRKITSAFVWGRDLRKARAFAAEHSAICDFTIRAAESCEEVARSCDILCTLTAAEEPFLKGDWLTPGVHLNVVGSSIPTTAEVDSVAVKRSRFFADYEDSARALAGEFRRACETHTVGDSHMLGSVGDVLTHRIPGRRSQHDITLFKSLGMISEDLMAAHVVLKSAVEHDLGEVVAF